MVFFSVINRMLKRLAYLGFLAAAFLLLVVGIMGTADVVSTNLLFKPIPGMVELSGALLGVIVFLGLAEAQARGAHVVIDVATGVMSPRWRKITLMFSLAVGAAFMAIVAWRTTELAIKSFSYNETALGALAFPLTPFKAVAAFGAWLSVSEFVRQLIWRTVTPSAIEAGSQVKDDSDA